MLRTVRTLLYRSLLSLMVVASMASYHRTRVKCNALGLKSKVIHGQNGRCTEVRQRFRLHVVSLAGGDHICHRAVEIYDDYPFRLHLQIV